MRIEELCPDHLEGFVPAYPICEIPECHFGKAAAFVRGGEVAALCFLSDFDGVLEVAVVQSAEVGLSAVASHRLALDMIRGLRIEGHRHLRAHTDSSETARWLRVLGFEETSMGVFEKWL
jgi:hypothetical protein